MEFSLASLARGRRGSVESHPARAKAAVPGALEAVATRGGTGNPPSPVHEPGTSVPLRLAAPSSLRALAAGREGVEGK